MQLGINFEKEKDFEWSNNKRYDFYVKEKSCIIETHGLQHYKYTGLKRSLKEEQENEEEQEQATETKDEDDIIIDDSDINVD